MAAERRSDGCLVLHGKYRIWRQLVRTDSFSEPIAGRRSNAWDPSSEFFKAFDRNMHGRSLLYDETTGVLHLFNGMAREGIPGYDKTGLIFKDKYEEEFTGVGLFAALLSYDEGESRPVSKLITPADDNVYYSRHVDGGPKLRVQSQL